MDDETTIGRTGFEALLIGVVTSVLLVLLLAPIAMVAVMSFTGATTLQFPPPEWSLRWYGDIWSMLANPDGDFTRLREALVTSIVIASLASLLCLAAGLPASYALARYRFSGKAAIEEAFVSVPIIFPTVVLGVALLVIVSVSGIDLGVFQLVIAHAIIGLPFMMRNCIPAIQGVDPALQEAAKTLGASDLRAFFEVVFPLIRGAVSSGILLVFVLSFNEFTLAFFLHTIDVFPLSIWLFQQSNTSFSPAIFAISALMILFNVAVIIVLDRLVGNSGAQDR